MATSSNSTYRDLNLNFLPHPVTGDLVMLTDVQAVIQSMKNLILTSVGEILMEPNIGGDVYKLLFELNTQMLRMQLHDRITTTLNRFEPRVELKSVTITEIANGQGVYVKVVFYVLNQPEPIVESFPLKRTR